MDTRTTFQIWGQLMRIRRDVPPSDWETHRLRLYVRWDVTEAQCIVIWAAVNNYLATAELDFGRRTIAALRSWAIDGVNPTQHEQRRIQKLMAEFAPDQSPGRIQRVNAINTRWARYRATA